MEALKHTERDEKCLEDKDAYVDNDGDNRHMMFENKALIKKIKRYRGDWKVFDAWMSLLENCGTVAEYLRKKNYKSVAIYGYGMLGKNLVYQLKT